MTHVILNFCHHVPIFKLQFNFFCLFCVQLQRKKSSLFYSGNKSPLLLSKPMKCNKTKKKTGENAQFFFIQNSLQFSKFLPHIFCWSAVKYAHTVAICVTRIERENNKKTDDDGRKKSAWKIKVIIVLHTLTHPRHLRSETIRVNTHDLLN